MTDADSLYSFTDTLVDRGDSSTTTLASAQDSLGTLVLHQTNSHGLDVRQLERAGLPSAWHRSDRPANLEPSPGFHPPKLTKRLHLRVPRDMQLLHAVRIPHVTSLEALANVRKQASKTGRLRTIYDSELCELVGRRERTRMHAVVRLLFGTRGIKSSKFFYPPQRVHLPYSQSAAGVPVQWATLILTSPPLTTEPEESCSPADDLAKTMACLRSKTDNELLAQLFKPSDHAEAMLDDVLNALEARGGIWTVAAHRSRPQPRNADPQQRPEFVVQGLFPKSFLNRCARYQRKASRVLPSDIDSDDKTQLITATTAETSAEGSGRGCADKDRLEGFRIGMTLEPVNTGSPWEQAGTASMVGVGMAMTGGGFGGC